MVINKSTMGKKTETSNAKFSLSPVLNYGKGMQHSATTAWIFWNVRHDLPVCKSHSMITAWKFWNVQHDLPVCKSHSAITA